LKDGGFFPRVRAKTDKAAGCRKKKFTKAKRRAFFWGCGRRAPGK
jgi:hypothetical protein